MRRALLTALVLVATTGSQASATAIQPLTLAQQRAQEFWGATPCGGAYTIAFDTTNGDQGLTYGCSTHLSQPLFATSEQQAASWPQFCRVVTHELGHAILGSTFFAEWNPADPAHSASPGSVMFYMDPAYPTTCFPATLTVGATRYHYVLRNSRVRAVFWTARRNGRVTARGILIHAFQQPWYRPAS